MKARKRVVALCMPAVATVVSALSMGVSAQTQSYPDKPITLIAASPAGGVLDQLARTYAKALKTTLGQSIVVENRAGAGGTLAANAVAKAAPDGYTLCFCFSGPVALAKATMDKLPYDIDKDFLPVARAYTLTPIITVPISSPIKNMPELLKEARAKPGTLAYGHTGVGGALHLGMEELARRAEVQLNAISYNGESPMTPDLISGRLDIGMLSPLFAKTQADGGKLRILASMGPLPGDTGIPAVASVPGLEGFAAGSWTGFFLPAGTPEPVLRKLWDAIQTASNQPDVKTRLVDSGVTPVVGETPEQFKEFVEREKRRAAAIMKRVGTVQR